MREEASQGQVHEKQKDLPVVLLPKVNGILPVGKCARLAWPVEFQVPKPGGLVEFRCHGKVLLEGECL